MERGLHNLQPGQKRKTRKRVGRGTGSGLGTFSGRGVKGQRARSGGKSGLKRRGLKQYLLQIPKVRGFKRSSSVVAVNVGQLEKIFTEGDHITPKALVEKGLIRPGKQVKILNGGNIKKKFSISAHAVSKSAEASIKKTGGTFRIITRS